MTLVAACQLALAIGEVGANLATAEDAIRTAAGAGAALVVVPELTPSGYVFEDAAELGRLAEPLDGPTLRRWRDLSRELGIVLVGGFPEEAAGSGAVGRRFFNSAVLIEDGEVLATYRKAHLWDREKLVFTPGDQPPPVVQTRLGRIGVMICYDVEFPEWVRLVALAGADLLAVPTNWPVVPTPAGERPINQIVVQAAAGANRLAIVAADRTRTERGVTWVGGSCIAGPDGYLLAGDLARAAEPDAPRTLLAELDLAASRDKRLTAHNDALADRRTDLYG